MKSKERLEEKTLTGGFVKHQPPRIRAVLELYIEKGDIRLAQKIAGLEIEDFINLLRVAKIPKVTLIWEENEE